VPAHVGDLVECLDPRRFDITVACPPGSATWRRLAARPGVSLLPLTARRAPHPSDVLWALRLVPHVRRSDVVHAHSSKAAWVARAAAVMAGRRSRCVVTPHGWSFWALSGAGRRIVVVGERAAARCCARIVAVSAAEREAGLRLGIGTPSLYRVVPNGIDLSRAAGDRPPDSRRVLFLGRLAAQKRPDLAVRALALARRTAPDLELTLCGEGEQRASLDALMTHLSLNKAVRMQGWCDDVFAQLRSCMCLLVTSTYEGCPLTVLEAMAAGVPVVAVRVPGMDEVVRDGETGILCSEDPGDIAAALVRLHRSPELACRLGEAGRELARLRHSRERMAAELASIYSALA